MNQLNDMSITSDGYILWLLNSVEIRNPIELDDSRMKLYRIMSETTFVALIDNDRYRIKDALYHRSKYFHTSFDQEDTCTILELLVSFTIRIVDDYLADDFMNPEYKDFFYELLNNLMLYDRKQMPSHIRSKLKIFVERKYDSRFGFGSLFPIKKKHIDYYDLRNMSLWNQMLLYISNRD